MSAAGLVGCASNATTNAGDSFFDPSVMGRWQHTPTVVPILDRIAAFEEQSDDLVEYSDPTPGDLIPQPFSYRLGPGDPVRVELWDLIITNQAETYEVTVDAKGDIDLPQIGRVNVGGRTVAEAIQAIQEPMKRLVSKPLANIIPLGRMQLSYNVLGAIERPGAYLVSKADFRVLEALSPAGRFDETTPEVFVIRQVPLTQEASGKAPPPSVQNTPADATGVGNPEPGKDFLKVIDEIAPKKDVPHPGMLSARQPTPGVAQPKAPVIGLVDDSTRKESKAEPGSPGSFWVFLNGKWVQLATPAPVRPEGGPPSSEQLVTQRVIRIPVKELLAGKQSVNIVVRPGDVIRVPAAPQGYVFVGGQVQRPGTYQLTQPGPLTLLRVLDAAGGLSGIAIPERIDLTRMVGHDRQGTIMLDGRAIARRLQPDLVLKPNDQITVGTNFWALPLAVVRNGFRASYGFGFVMDRNLSNDVFGPPPVNQFGQ